MDLKIITVSIIAMVCGSIAGTLGSPGFGMIVPLLMSTGFFPSFRIALGVYFMGIVLPDISNFILFILHNKDVIHFKINIIFTIIFAIFSALSIYFSKFIKDHHKFYTIGVIQFILGSWYLLNANKLKNNI